MLQQKMHNMHIILKCIWYFIYIFLQYIFYFFLTFTSSFYVIAKDITDKCEKSFALVVCYFKAKMTHSQTEHGDHEGHEHHLHDHEH